MGQAGGKAKGKVVVVRGAAQAQARGGGLTDDLLKF